MAKEKHPNINIFQPSPFPRSVVSVVQFLLLPEFMEFRGEPGGNRGSWAQLLLWLWSAGCPKETKTPHFLQEIDLSRLNDSSTLSPPAPALALVPDQENLEWHVTWLNWWQANAWPNHVESPVPLARLALASASFGPSALRFASQTPQLAVQVGNVMLILLKLSEC